MPQTQNMKAKSIQSVRLVIKENAARRLLAGMKHTNKKRRGLLFDRNLDNKPSRAIRKGKANWQMGFDSDEISNKRL